jgi:hypothetical protein
MMSNGSAFLLVIAAKAAIQFLASEGAGSRLSPG